VEEIESPEEARKEKVRKEAEDIEAEYQDARAENKKLAPAEKMDVYVKLLSVPDPGMEPEGSLSKRLKVDHPVLGGIIAQMKTNQSIRADLKKLGY
jgi:hypothetical protein